MRKFIISSTEKFIAKLKLLSIELLILIVAFIGSALLVVSVIKYTFLDNKKHLDEAATNFFNGFISDSFTDVMSFFTFFGGHKFLVPANLILIAYMFFIKKDNWFAIKVSSVAITSLIMMFTLKYFFNRQRPLIPLLEPVSGLSFPSGHAFMSFSFFGLLIYMAYRKIENKWLRVFLIFIFLMMIIIISSSRIYLRVHYATDVLAGLSFGLMWVVMSLWAVHLIEKYKKKTRIEVAKIES